MTTQQKTTLRPLVLAVHLSLASLAINLAVPHAHATAATSQQASHYHLPAGNLADVLARFAAQAKVQLSLDPTRLGTRSSPGLHGDYTPEAGFDTLLAGSSFIAVRTPQGYSIKPLAELPKVKVSATATATAPAETGNRTVADGVNEAQLETVRVSAAANLGGSEATATSPVKGYVAKKSATAGRIAADQVEITQSLSIVGQEEMKARGVGTTEEAIRYTPGINAAPWGFDERETTLFTLRGFSNPAGAYIDGFYQLTGGFGAHIFDTYGMERIEVLRGAASVMVGDSEVSGLVNRISKRPQKDMINELGIGIGDAGQKELRADLGGEFLEKDNVQYRLTLRTAENGSRADFKGASASNSRRYYFAPSFSWQPTSRLNLTLLAAIRDNHGPAHNLEYINADQSRSRVLVTDPNFSKFDHKQSRIAFEASYQLSDNWHYRQQFASSRVESETDATWLAMEQGSADAAGDVARYAFAYTDVLRNRNWLHQIDGTFKTGKVEHALAVGFDWHKYNGDNRANFGFAPSVNIHQPVYLPIDIASMVPSSAGADRVTKAGWFIQNRMQIEQWGADLALRQDNVRKITSTKLSNTMPVDEHSDQKDQATTGRLGINYRLANGLLPYFNYGTSFQTQVGRDRAGKHFSPSTGAGIELGLKYQSADGRSLLTAAWYQQRKQNMRTPDPVDQNYSIQTGEVKVQGLELEARYSLSKQWNLLGSYSYNNSEVSKSTGSNLGKQLTLMPAHMATLWLDYTFPTGWGAGVGARYKGKDFADESNTVVNAGHTLLDAALWYKQGPWHARLNVSNLANRDYITNIAWGSPAQKRKINLNIDYKF